MECVKEIFEAYERPFIYDIEKDEIVNPEDKEEDEEKDEEDSDSDSDSDSD
jgi:hypothetical protein